MTYLLSPALDERATGRSSGISRIFSYFGRKDFPLAGEKSKKTTTGKSFFNVQDANVTGTSQGLDNFVTQGYIAY